MELDIIKEIRILEGRGGSNECYNRMVRGRGR